MTVTGNYIEIADQIVDEIKRGHLKPGDKMLPQREFAYQTGIAASTASRVYAELVRRGVVVGEVGRGTFIRAFDHRSPELGEPAREPINMQFNFSVLEGQAEDMLSGLSNLQRPDILENAMLPIKADGDSRGRSAAASLLKFGDWMPNPDHILFTAGGRQGIAAAMSSIASPGDRLGIEYLTYPVIKGIAARLGINLVPIEMDEEGLSVDMLAREHASMPLKGIYFQPTLHNPLGTTMSEGRRQQLADFIGGAKIYVIEDVLYGFLKRYAPIGKLVPEYSLTVESLSKRLSPGLSFGFTVCPEELREGYIAALRTGGWIASGLSYATCINWIADGTVAKYEELRREEARERQKIVSDILGEFKIYTDPVSYHFWMELPGDWRAESFCAAVASRGVAISPASIFYVTPGAASNHIRVAIAPPNDTNLIKGLKLIRNLARTNENDLLIE